MLKYLVPHFPLRDLPVMLGYALLGSLIAGTYGIIHDHLTYSISREYFTHFKFDQFNWANLRLGSRGFVTCIGFLATWWVGFIVAWILARRMIPKQSRTIACRKILFGFGIVFVAVFVFGLLGYAYGIFRGPDGDYSAWEPGFERLGVSDKWSFLRVAYIHNAGYLGALIGFVLTFFIIRPGKPASDESQ